jgi:hypothetical protein
LSLLSDQPADEDQLNFAPYAQTLADVIAEGNVQTPLTIGVFGSWGSGKTSLMTMVKRRLDALQREGRRAGEEAIASPHLTVWFNAWLYGQEQALWRALILEVLFAQGGSVTRPPVVDRLGAGIGFPFSQYSVKVHLMGCHDSGGSWVFASEVLFAQGGSMTRPPAADRLGASGRFPFFQYSVKGHLVGCHDSGGSRVFAWEILFAQGGSATRPPVTDRLGASERFLFS